MSLITRKAKENRSIDCQCHKIYLSGPFGIFCFTSWPYDLLLAGANNRNAIITDRFLAVPVQANRDFFLTYWLFNFWRKDQLTKKKDQILIKGSESAVSENIKQNKQGWFYSREYIYIFTNISEGTAFLLQGLTYNLTSYVRPSEILLFHETRK